MRKLISSSFIFLLLLLSLWGVSAWYLGTKTEESLKVFFDENRDNSDDLFQYELLSYSSSIFSSNIKVLVNLNNQTQYASLLDNSLVDIPLDVSILNGPIFIDKSGFKLGRSMWEIVLHEKVDDDQIDSVNSENYLYNKISNQLDRVEFIFDFEDNSQYQIALNSDISNILIKGSYNTQQFLNSGYITAKKLTYKNKSYRIDTKNINIKFDHITKSKNDKTISISTNIPQLVYQHQGLAEPIRLELASKGNISLDGELLNSSNKLSIKNAENSIYPLNKSDLALQITDLNIESLIAVLKGSSQIKNLEQQMGWVLEEQGGLPEGQDQIWQLQDRIKTYNTDLSKLVAKVVNPNVNNESTFNFMLKGHNLNKSSVLKGSLELLPKSVTIDSATPKSLMSLTQLKAVVELDDDLYQYLSKKIPIKDNNFKLIVRNNKLLMQ